MWIGASAPRRLRAAIAAASCAVVVACGAGRAIFVPPSGPGDPAPDAAAAWAEATSDCRDLRSVVSTFRVSGRIADARVWPITVEAAVIANQSIYLSAVASGKPVFMLVGTPSRATLWLRTDDRAVSADPSAILQALVGVSLSADDVLGVLSGCVAHAATMGRAARHGGVLSVETSAGTAHLEQRAGRWSVRAFQSATYTAEFVPPGRALPQDAWVWSKTGAAAASLRLAMTEREVNGPVPEQVFRVPPGAIAAAPITLEELATMWKNRAPLPWSAP
jgi:hypothetical protein